MTNKNIVIINFKNITFSIKICNNIQVPRLLLTGETHAHGQSIYLAPAVLYHMEHVNLYTLDLSTLYKESARSAEEACVQVRLYYQYMK